MRIQFEFNIEKLPLSYRLGTLSVLKEMIHTGSSKFYDYLFIKNKTKMKPFTHASYVQNLKLSEDEIFGEKLILTVSSSSYEFIMHLMNGSHRKTNYQYKNFKLTLTQKRLLPKPPKFSPIITFKTGSPVLIETKDKKPLLGNEKGFEKEFNYYAELLSNELYNRNLFESLKIINIATKKVVIKEHLHQDQGRPIYLTANHGLIQLQGHPEDLKLIYENGIGRRRSLGLGLLNIEEVTYQ